MSFDELLIFIQDVRARRRQPLSQPKKVATKKARKTAKPLNLFEAAKGMTTDMKSKLLKELLGDETP